MSVFQTVRRRFDPCYPLQIMNIEDIRKLDNEKLLGIYTDFVAINHYDPFETPQFAKDLYEAKISEDDLRGIILERMK